jgi:putative restriction endonuclease
MAKAVFDVNPGSGYDDDIVSRYHFPAKRPYVEAAESAINDWVLYREPRRNGGRQAYVATAKVTAIEPDPARTDHRYAYVRDYLAFPMSVPFVAGGRYAEQRLRDLANPRSAGQALQGRAMRPISEADFAEIVRAGLAESLAPENTLRLGLEDDFETTEFPSLDLPGVGEATDRRVDQILLNRKVRDASFRLEVCRAYDDTCAVTGLRIVNGGGRSEVQAAHIWPVAEGGPDVVQNGLALSATVHWLFDRHLISVGDDFRLLVAHNRVPAELRALFRPSNERLRLPKNERLWPHPVYLARHREAFANKAA